MRILAFVYDFPHFKSAQGLFALKRAGFNNVLAVGAPWRKLPIQESSFQFRTHDMADSHHPREACEALGYSYYMLYHEDSVGCIAAHKPDVCVILGARVLPRDVVLWGTPIVNIHPGTLPLNRGLDTLKWAVHDGLPQAVAAHVIDHRIDRGELIFEEIVNVYTDDSPGDIYNRLMWKQIEAIPRALQMIGAPRTPVERGVYRKPMTPAEDETTRRRFAAYKASYSRRMAA
jgi:phosphoribosylglycinamide formyltransferase-1